MLSVTISIVRFRSANIPPLRYEANDKVSLCRKQAYHLLLEALLQIVGGDKLIIPFC